MKRAIAMLLLCASTAPVKAQPLALDPWLLEIGSELPPAELLDLPDARFLQLEVAQKAPYRGILLDNETAARWTARLVWYQDQLKKDSDDLRAAMGKREAALTKLHLGDAESYKREIKGLRVDLRDQAKQFELAKKQPFWKTWGFGLILGVIVGAAASGFSVWAGTK